MAQIRRMIGALAIAGLAYLGFAALSFLEAVRPPRYPWRTTPGEFGLPYEEVRFISRDGTGLVGWWVPGKTGRAPVVVVHGYGAAMDDVVPLGAFLARAGYPLLCPRTPPRTRRGRRR